MWLFIMRRWVRYRLTFQVLFYSVVVLGMYLGMHASAPKSAVGLMAPLYHAGGLFACTMLSYLAYPRWNLWFRGLLLFMVGFSIELAQSFQPNRTADLKDIYFNSLGVGAALIAIMLWERYGKWHAHRRVTQ